MTSPTLGARWDPPATKKIPDRKKEMEIIENLILRIPGVRGIGNRIKWVNNL